MTIASRRFIEAVALIRPPSVNTGIKHGFVTRPVATDRQITRLRIRTAVRDASGELSVFRLDHDVQDHTKMQRVKLIDVGLRLGKVRLVKSEFRIRLGEAGRRLLHIPPGRSEACSEIDQRVTGKLLLAESLRDGLDGFPSAQRSV